MALITLAGEPFRRNAGAFVMRWRHGMQVIKGKIQRLLILRVIAIQLHPALPPPGRHSLTRLIQQGLIAPICRRF